MLKHWKVWVAAAAMGVASGVAQADLIKQSSAEVLDTKTNLVWLHDWSSPGVWADWNDAKAWAESLTVGGAAGAWRLPDVSEYKALFNAYGNLTKVSAFTNVQARAYWSGTENLPSLDAVTVFFPQDGGQTAGVAKTGGSVAINYAMAVRTFDGAAVVPEPQSLALVLLALGATAVLRRRRPA
jgi:hypothetical protein